MLKFMLDTNICIAVIRDRPERARHAFREHQDRMCISSVSAMELFYGVERSTQRSRNLAIVEGFIARLDVVNYDRDAAAHTAEIRAKLRAAGQEVGPYDQMIAGHARSRGFVVVTNNRREFDRIPGLMVENWLTT